MLSPATLSLILAGFQLAVKEAPKVIELAKKFKEYISALFQSGLITIEQQSAIHTYVDSVTALVDSGVIPTHFLVEPDPQ